MRKLVVIALGSALLAGCANFGTNVQTAWELITSASVSPTQIIVAGNSFDAAEASATQYLTACKAKALPASACLLSIRRKVVAAVRAGRAARNQLEPYVTSGQAGPSALYNTMVAAINSLQSSIPPTTGAAK